MEEEGEAREGSAVLDCAVHIVWGAYLENLVLEFARVVSLSEMHPARCFAHK